MAINNFPRVTAILARIPDAATRWPGWFDAFCPRCDKLDPSDLDISTHEGDCDGIFFCEECGTQNTLYRFAPIIDEVASDAWHGNDLDPRNMHHLWAMLEALNEHGNPRIMCGGAFLFIGEEIHEGYGPNIIEAMLRCLEEAVK